MHDIGHTIGFLAKTSNGRLARQVEAAILNGTGHVIGIQNFQCGPGPEGITRIRRLVGSAVIAIALISQTPQHQLFFACEQMQPIH